MPRSSRQEGDKLDRARYHLMNLNRVTLDTSVLVGSKSVELAIAARLRYYQGYWSNWIVSEFSRVRTAMILRRARRELGITEKNEDDAIIQGEIEQRLQKSKAKVQAAIDEFTGVFINVSYKDATASDLSWLVDKDDIPIMQTALAAGAPGVLVTDNSDDFPIGEVRHGILIVSSTMFLNYIYETYSESKAVINSYADNRRQALREGRLPPPLSTLE